MYNIEIIEHFEDWYVVDETLGEFNTINEAISVFCKECKNIVKQRYSTSGIDEYIAESFDNDEVIDEFNKGFMLRICNDRDESIVSQHFEYNHKSHSIENGSGVEVHHENLSEKEAKFLLASSLNGA
ncbi:MAG: hypothetical protein NTW85_14900 [Methylococcales bacterium]|nr:hypothetical protein [Methylococcales bacterium]